MKKTALLLTFIPFLCFAQISTDQPGEGTSSSVLNPDALQLESGFQYDRSDKEMTSDHLLRFGISKRWEVGLHTTQNFTEYSQSTYGVSSKYALISGDDRAPTLTVIGSADLKGDDYALLLSSDHDLSRQVSISVNAGYRKHDGLHRLFASAGGTLELVKNLNLFAEYYGFFSSRNTPDHYADFGFTYIPASSIQLDVSVGAAPDDIPGSYYVGTGISYRFR